MSKLRNWPARRAKPGKQRRQGTTTVLVLICLLVVVSFVGTMLQSAVRARRQLQTERNRRQAELLLDAGIDRASYRLVAEPEYRGEIWTPDSTALAGRAQVVATITPTPADASATPSSSRTPSWQVEVIAEFPVGNPNSIRRSHAFLFNPSQYRVQD